MRTLLSLLRSQVLHTSVRPPSPARHWLHFKGEELLMDAAIE